MTEPTVSPGSPRQDGMPPWNNFTLVQMRYPGGRVVTMPAEQSVTPGLFIVPTLTLDPHDPDRATFAGSWGVTHRSGLAAAAVAFTDITEARELAVKLGQTGVDWEASPEDLKSCTTRQTKAISDAVRGHAEQVTNQWLGEVTR